MTTELTLVPAPVETTATTTRVYKYGCREPVEGLELVREQMRLGSRYRNTLVEIERGRRDAVRAAIGALPDVAAAEDAARAAWAEFRQESDVLKGMRAALRKRRVDPALLAAYTTARDAYRGALKTLYAARKSAATRIADERDRIQELANELTRSARKHCGVYWGIYLLAEAELKQAAKMPLWDELEPSDPHFERFDGTGQVAVQIQGGMSVAELFDQEDTRARVAPVDPRCWDPVARAERAAAIAAAKQPGREPPRLERTTLAIRVGSTEKGRPVWARLPMVLHRPLPPAARIKWVTVSVRRIGPHEKWSAQITVEQPAVASPSAAPPRCVGVDLGWRVMADGIRVGTWQTSAGDRGEVRLDARDVARVRKVEDLQEIRDKNFNAARDALGAWLAANPHPAWLAARTRTLGQWRAIARLASVALAWRMDRFPGDAAAYEALEAWRKQDKHLWTWEAAQRENTLRHRREVFRVAAARQAARHDVLVLEDIDLRPLARRAETGDAEGKNPHAGSNRHAVSPSELRACLVNAFATRGKRVSYEATAWSTRTCHACGAVGTWDTAKDLSHTCVGCGVRWDQDDNAAKNLLAMYGERGGATRDRVRRKKVVASAGGESKWVRANRAAQERKARVAAAEARKAQTG